LLRRLGCFSTRCRSFDSRFTLAQDDRKKTTTSVDNFITISGRDPLQRHPEQGKFIFRVEGSVGSSSDVSSFWCERCLGYFPLYVASLKRLVLVRSLCRSFDSRFTLAQDDRKKTTTSVDNFITISGRDPLQRHPEQGKFIFRVEGSVGSSSDVSSFWCERCLGYFPLYVVSLRRLSLTRLLCRSFGSRFALAQDDLPKRHPERNGRRSLEWSRRICRVVGTMCCRLNMNVFWSLSFTSFL
jgi:hypothetical protein